MLPARRLPTTRPPTSTGRTNTTVGSTAMAAATTRPVRRMSEAHVADTGSGTGVASAVAVGNDALGLGQAVGYPGQRGVHGQRRQAALA